MAVSSLLCVLFISMFYTSAGHGPDLQDPGDGPQVWSASLASPIHQVVWIGNSTLTCDSECRARCPAVGAVASTRVLEGRRQTIDRCIAACGCGGGLEKLLVLTQSGQVFFSADAGVSWQALTSVLPAEALAAAAAAGPFHAKQLHVSAAAPQHAVVLTNSTVSWITKDGGSTWAPTHFPEEVVAWKWHPHNKDWVLAAGVKVGDGAKSSLKAPRRAYLSKDAGTTWSLLSKDVEQCHWFTRPGDNQTILLTRYVDGQASEEGSQPLLEVLTSRDFLKTHTQLIGKRSTPTAAVRVTVYGGFVTALCPDAEGRVRLWLHSNTAGHPENFQSASWPAKMEPPRPQQLRHLRVIYAAPHQVLFYIPAADLQFPWGHILSLSPGSAQLEKMMEDVHRPAEGLAWHALEGVEGIFLANRRILREGKAFDSVEKKFDAQAAAVQRRHEEEQAEEGWDAADTPEQLLARDAFLVRSYVSVNNGIAWQPLKASPESRIGTPEECVKAADNVSVACNVHLASWTSASAAPGIVVGVGNVGLKLSPNTDHHNVLISRDAGLNWKAVLEGPHAVSILAHGDVLFAVPEQQPSKAVFSVDGGVTWSPAPGTMGQDKTTVIQRIFSHPSHTDTKAFVSMGSDASSALALWVYDLTKALKTDCVEAANSPMNANLAEADAVPAGGSDFERWSPADALEDAHFSKRPACLLGVRTRYTRRAAGRTCRTGSAIPAPRDMRSDAQCDCTKLDWACAAGFQHATYTNGAVCEPVEGFEHPSISALCKATWASRVQVTQGYVKSPGNRCSGGLDLSPRLEPCSGNTGLDGAVREVYDLSQSWNNRFVAVFMMICFVLHRIGGSQMLGWKLRRCSGKKAKSEDFDVDDDEERSYLINGRHQNGYDSEDDRDL